MVLLSLCLAGAWVLTAAPPASTPRQIVLDQMSKRPEDSWPRSQGHVLLAYPGSLAANKAWHEPGANFSPAYNSFGVSLWIADALGAIQTTSERFELDQIRQQLLWPPSNPLPSLYTETIYYRASWSLLSPGLSRLILIQPTNSENQLSLLIRSAGPAGGPVQSLAWNGRNLVINGRWTLTFDPSATNVCLGREGDANWTTKPAGEQQGRYPDGWGFARVPIPKTRQFTLTIHDASVPAPAGLTYSHTRAGLDVKMPEEQFSACLNAQAAHLMMGVNGLEINPSDPLATPYSSLREGAYVVTALACAGQVTTASQLARNLAERDYFGPQGPEADAPGLALWAMEEVSARLRQRNYDTFLYPHLLRKAQLIRDMLRAEKPIRKPAPPTPDPRLKTNPDLYLICEAARNGLIIGKADGARPVLFVNASAYRGLLSAANIAERLNAPVNYMFQWRLEAGQLRESWVNGLKSALGGEDRTYVNGLWPTWAAGYHREIFAQNLPNHLVNLSFDAQPAPDSIARPAFLLAKAHQSLFLNKPDQTWETLKWFWKNQASPGFFTWGEAFDRESPYQVWSNNRGWVKPQTTSPHYGAAAEMLMLQLDMLAYLDESGAESALVIGAGIPAYWLDKPMSVRNLHTKIGIVNWTWLNGRMSVVIQGRRCPLRLGPAFSPNALAKVDYLNP